MVLSVCQLLKEREEELGRQATAEAEKRKPKSRKEEPTLVTKTFTAGVGKYINPTAVKRQISEAESNATNSSKKKFKTKTSLTDFSAW
ncbi:hypothetical protein DPMN_008407 [Dreissena polymorpha]|uniref:Uncharacterized protein n=1 Tax=Dreissena polymorpha TaxID=45954 RepID=A0A9D4RXA8_DREPO|nr:hypothetical protein DPMN_008407 [Dreissena polymorpha]